MAIVKDYLDPNAVAYTDDQIVGKVNAATANITRASSVEATARPIGTSEVTDTMISGVSADKVADGTTNKAYTATEKTKLGTVEDNATADQTGAEVRDLVVALTDDTRQIIISRPTTGQYKVYAIQKHTDGKTEIERNSVAS